MSLTLPQGMTISGAIQPGFDAILTPEALAFVADLHRTFEARRQELLAARVERTARLDAGERPDFLASTPPRWPAAAWRSPARWTPRWSSTPSTRAPTAT
jgi:malate synthase